MVFKLLTAAARSICPAGAAGLAAAPPGLGGAAGVGLGAEGTGGFPPTIGFPPGGLGGAPGLAATGGGFGFAATGGGGLPAMELGGLELAGVLFEEPPFEAAGVFFHGAADPLAAAIPGNTETGLAEESADTALIPTFETAGAALGAAGAADAEGGGRRFGGGGGAATALGFGGTNSR